MASAQRGLAPRGEVSGCEGERDRGVWADRTWNDISRSSKDPNSVPRVSLAAHQGWVCTGYWGAASTPPGPAEDHLHPGHLGRREQEMVQRRTSRIIRADWARSFSCCLPSTQTFPACKFKAAAGVQFVPCSHWCRGRRSCKRWWIAVEPTPLFLGYSQHLKCESPRSQS